MSHLAKSLVEVNKRREALRLRLAQLDHLSKLLADLATDGDEAPAKRRTAPARRLPAAPAPKQLTAPKLTCTVCGEPGHNARRHKNDAPPAEVVDGAPAGARAVSASPPPGIPAATSSLRWSPVVVGRS